MMTHQNPFIGGVIVRTILIRMGGGDAAGVESEHFGGDKGTVVTIADRQYAERSDHERKGMHEERKDYIKNAQRGGRGRLGCVVLHVAPLKDGLVPRSGLWAIGR